MRISLSSRAARAFAAAIVVFSLSLAPSYAHMGGGGSFARPASGFGHFSHFASRGFNQRFGFNHSGFSRFGPNRFDRFGFNRSNRFGFNRFGNQLFVGGWGGWGWGGWGAPVSMAPSEPIVVGDGAPVIINIGTDRAPSDGGAGAGGGCVTHKLLYDSAGKFVGERQTSQC